MYKQLHQNPQVNNILVVQFRNLKQNENVRLKCEKTLQCDLCDDDYIIYSPTKSDITVLGWLVINDSHITSSNMYNSLRNNTISYHGEDYTDILQQITCRKIEEWLFDKTLKNKVYLTQIFSVVCRECGQKATILWCEGSKEILFYPISNDPMKFARPSAVTYFTNTFMQE